MMGLLSIYGSFEQSQGVLMKALGCLSSIERGLGQLMVDDLP